MGQYCIFEVLEVKLCKFTLYFMTFCECWVFSVWSSAFQIYQYRPLLVLFLFLFLFFSLTWDACSRRFTSKYLSLSTLRYSYNIYIVPTNEISIIIISSVVNAYFNSFMVQSSNLRQLVLYQQNLGSATRFGYWFPISEKWFLISF